MLLDCNSVISKPRYSKSFSTDSPVGPFVGSDDHIVRVVNRKGNACRQARVHWLRASLVFYLKRPLIGPVGLSMSSVWISKLGMSLFRKVPASLLEFRQDVDCLSPFRCVAWQNLPTTRTSWCLGVHFPLNVHLREVFFCWDLRIGVCVRLWVVSVYRRFSIQSSEWSKFTFIIIITLI